MKRFIIFLGVSLFVLDQGVAPADTDEVSVMEGDSVTLHTGVKKTQQDRIRWYYKDTRIAQINGDPSKICTDVQCNEGTESFRDRLKLDHQTGSLTIVNLKTEDSGEYYLKIFSISSIREKTFSVSVIGLPSAEQDKMKTKSVMKGEPVTLEPGVINNPNDVMTWYFNDTLIAEITGDQSQICADDQCKERFRDSSVSITRVKRFSVSVNGVSSEVSVMEGDSVTLHTGVKTSHQEKIKWYCNDIRIAQISGDLSYICTDLQCNEGTERFRDRLKLDHQTGSLTITHTTTEDSGEYELKIFNSRDDEKIFNITVQGVSAAERDEVKRKSVMEGESVTFDSGVIKNTNDSMMWYFNDVLIAEITGDQSQICADDQCKERFRDRLKLDHQTGALTITHTTNTDPGQYKLQMMIINSSFSINRVKRFSVSVTAVPGSGLSAGAVAGIVIGVLLVFAAVGTAAVIYYRHRIYTPPTAQNDDDL